MAETQKEKVVTPKTLPAVATNFYYPCKKCEADRYHKVLAHSTSLSAKLECEVCHGKSTFRMGRKSTKKAKSQKKKEAESMWIQLKSRVGTDRIIPYNMTGFFPIRSAIEHPKFGLGFVTAVQDKKIEVTFETGPKLLVHNRPQ